MSGLIQFGEFVLDCNRYELLRAGHPIKLEKFPMELLILLVTRGGHLVTRQEIIEHLWGTEVFLDTEHGINTAIRKIRLALNASIGGVIGTVVSITGAATTWNRGLGPHWYPVALIFVALPSAWVGGSLRLTQLGRQAVA